MKLVEIVVKLLKPIKPYYVIKFKNNTFSSEPEVPDDKTVRLQFENRQIIVYMLHLNVSQFHFIQGEMLRFREEGIDLVSAVGTGQA